MNLIWVYCTPVYTSSLFATAKLGLQNNACGGLDASSQFVMLSTFGAIVAVHLRGMRPAPTTKKDTVMHRKNSNTNTIIQTFKNVLLDYF